MVTGWLEEVRAVLEDIVDALACPHCHFPLTWVTGSSVDNTRRPESLQCGNGHVFDVARQGYVNLLSGSGVTGDSAAMVAARTEFLDAKHFAAISDLLKAVCQGAADPQDGYIVDVGAGTGHYLAEVQADLPGQTGVAVDVSKYAARRAAKRPGIAAVVADAWRSLPVRDSAASLVLNVFAPRNAVEMHRILCPGGSLVVVTPNDGHLAELVHALGLLTVDARKQDRLEDQLGAHFWLLRQTQHEFTMSLSHHEVETLVAMGPSARHMGSDAVRHGVAAMPEPVTVTGSVTLSVYRKLPA